MFWLSELTICAGNNISRGRVTPRGAKSTVPHFVPYLEREPSHTVAIPGGWKLDPVKRSVRANRRYCSGEIKE
jgi:hypothetical protein